MRVVSAEKKKHQQVPTMGSLVQIQQLLTAVFVLCDACFSHVKKGHNSAVYEQGH